MKLEFSPVKIADIAVHQVIVYVLKTSKWYTTAKPETFKSVRKVRVINEKGSLKPRNYLSDSKANCWFAGSLRALANKRLSASTIDILPHTTCT